MHVSPVMFIWKYYKFSIFVWNHVPDSFINGAVEMLNFLQNSLQNNYISEDWILKNIDLKRIKWHEFARLVYFFTHHLPR